MSGPPAPAGARPAVCPGFARSPPMAFGDTHIGGPQRRFPSTHWSRVLEAGRQGGSVSRLALDELIRRYWKPVYAYLRAAWPRPNEDAKDVTQAFFTHLLEGGAFGRLKPDRGSFRGYLKRALHNFVIDAARRESVRAAVRPVAPLDLEQDGAQESPEKAYDREWFRDLLHRSIEELKSLLQREDRSVHFEVFHDYCLEPARDPAPTYRDTGHKFGLAETEVRHVLEHCRRELRRILRERIKQYAAADEDVESELKLALST